MKWNEQSQSNIKTETNAYYLLLLHFFLELYYIVLNHYAGLNKDKIIKIQNYIHLYQHRR